MFLMAILLFLFSEAAMAQSGSWSDANYQNPNWGKDYNSKSNLDVNNEIDFAKFAAMVNEGKDFRGKTVTLKAHLTMSRNIWVPIGTKQRPFRGTFKGGNFSISGIHLKENGNEYAGLFGYILDGSVVDVQLVGSKLTGETYVGAIAGGLENARIADCSLETNVDIEGQGQKGYFAGLLKNNAKIEGCVSNSRTEGLALAGSQDETCVIRHSLHTDGKNFTVNSQPAHFVHNEIADASLNYGTPTANYPLTNINAYDNGMTYGGGRLAVKGETVTFSIEGATITSGSKVMANNVFLTASGGRYTLTMGDEDAYIRVKDNTGEWKCGTTICRLKDGVFTVSPTTSGGEMADYGKPEDSPWYLYADDIKKVIFEDGVTKIGTNNFVQIQPSTMYIPESMRIIQENAFIDCYVHYVYCYPAANNLQIGKNVFTNRVVWYVFYKQLAGYEEKLDHRDFWVRNNLEELTLDAQGDNTALLESADGSVCDVTLKGLKLVREGFTLCLPFDVKNIGTTPLRDAVIHEITDFQVTDKNIRLRISPLAVTNLKAGKLYYGSWKTAGGDLQSPVFKDVTIQAATAPEQMVYNSCTLQGMYNAATIKDKYTYEMFGGISWQSRGMKHGAFGAYLTSPERINNYHIAVCDRSIDVVHINKPAWWPDVTVKDALGQLNIHDFVEEGRQLTLTATMGIGYDIEWYVNGVKQQTAANSITVTVKGDTKVEARYIERKKLTFKGSPLVRYADNNGVVNITQNYYNYDYVKVKAFGNTVHSWTGSNGKIYLVDNLLQDNQVTTEKLTADMEMVPTTVYNEEDMGDNTVTVKWRFDLPDSMALFRNEHGEGAKFPYVMPTEFASYYIDVVMTIDATNGLVSNDLRKAQGNTFVGKGTKLTVPARYGATYRLLTTKQLSEVSLEGSKDFIHSKVGNNYLASMQYYRTDLDSLVIDIGEDIELISLEAAYPGGDNELMVRPTVNKAESTITTQLKVGESGCLLYNLSDVQNHGNLKITPSAHATGTSLIEMPAQFDENRYMSVSFEVKKGYSFKPKTTSLYTMPVNTGNKANVRLMLIDELGNKADTIFNNVAQNVMKLDTLKPKAPSKAEELCLYGKVELRIYVYGTAGNYRLGDSITIGGELCQTIRFPEGQTYVPQLITSPIDFDGLGLLHIEAFEVVHASEETQMVTMTALEECPMGNVMLLKSDVPGALYNIPLTRADDSYIAGQGILKVSDGTVIGTKRHYVFGLRDGVYGFYMAAIGDPIDEGDIYFYHDGIKDLLAYYLDAKDVPPAADEVILFADGDNNPTIREYDGRNVNRVTLGGRTFYKDGRWNVITLPFHMQGREIKNSPLKNATICEFDPNYTTFDPATGQLYLAFEYAYEIDAGKAYLVSWNKGEDLPNPTFENVTFIHNKLIEETSVDGNVTFHPSYASVDFKDSDQTLMTIRNSISNDSCMHALKAYFTLKAADTGVTEVFVDINTDDTWEYQEVADENALYAIYYNKVVDYEEVMLSEYRGEGGVVEIADSINVNIDGNDVEMAVQKIDANAFSSVGHKISAIDLTHCQGLRSLTVDRTTPDTPFFGLNEGAVVYLPASKGQPADNVVVGGICQKLVLDDQYGFPPIYDFKAQEVVLKRATTATNGWQAFCLPFALTQQATKQWNGQLLEFAGAKKENGTLTLFCNESEAIPAGTPGIIRWTSGAPEEMKFSDVAIQTVQADSADFNGVSLYGSYMPVTLSDTDQAKLFVVDSRSETHMLPGFQAYFKMDDEVTDDFTSVCVNHANGNDYEAIESLTGHYDVAYVLWCEGNKTLYFTVPDNRVKVGDTYNGQTVTSLWKGAEVLMAGNDGPGWNVVNSQAEHVVFDESFKRARPTSCRQWFSNFAKLTAIQDLHNLCTSEVTTMAYMFDGCSSLKELTLGFFDTSNVTSMHGMFYGCYELEHLNLNAWNTQQVTDMGAMFRQCYELSDLDLRNFDTRSVTDMGYMFNYCENLTDINLTGFNTSNVTNMSAMFKNCLALKELDLTNFNTGNVTNMSFMFENNNSLTTITVGNGWSTQNVQNSLYMFRHDVSLSGQNGTHYAYEHDSSPAHYAHIDGGTDNPGLFWGVADVTLKDLEDNSETLNQYGGHRVNVDYDRQFSAVENADGTWTSRAYTVCLPYEKDLQDYFDAGQIRLYQLAFVNEDHEFVFISNEALINAGTPYLLVVDKGTVSLNAENVKMLAHPNEHVEENIVYNSNETWGDPDYLVGWWRGTFRVIDNEECTQMHAYALTTNEGKWKTFSNDTEAQRAAYIPQFRGYFVPLDEQGAYEYNTQFKSIPAGEDEVIPDWEKLPDEFVGDISDFTTGINPVIRTIDNDGTHQYYDLSGRKLNSKPQKGIYIDNGKKRVVYRR